MTLMLVCAPAYYRFVYCWVFSQQLERGKILKTVQFWNL
nr:MAG TPA: hypothetical protein [Inoviridae sp.]